MLLSNSKKFILFHFPKTGGSSMTYALAKYLTPAITPPEPDHGFMGWQPRHHIDRIQHKPIKECMQESPWPKDYFTASFVRNPYDIVVSAWHNKEQSFEEFVMKEVATRKNIISRFGSQYDFLSNHRGGIMVDFVGRYEKLDIDWKKFCYFVKLNEPLKKINSSWKNHYSTYYNARTFQIVTTLYKKDLDFFGYTLDKPAE